MNAAHRSVRRADLGLYMTTILAVLAALIMLRLRAANDLVATGLRIHELEVRREEALQARALWLVRYAEASQPEVLARRARELGFGPPSQLVYLPADVLGASQPSAAWTRPDSALALLASPRGSVAGEPPPAHTVPQQPSVPAVASAADSLWP